MKLLTIAVLAVLPVLGTTIDLSATDADSSPSSATDFHRGVLADGSLSIQMVAGAINGGQADFSHEIILNATGNGPGYVLVTATRQVNETGGEAWSFIAVNGINYMMAVEKVDIFLGQNFDVVTSGFAHSYQVTAPHTTAASVRMDAQIRAFDSFDQPVAINIIQSPEPATFGLIGIGIFAGALRFRRTLC
jgi:hypothetical protein